MREEKSFPTPLAVVADIHGNRWALEAVLQDINRRSIQQIVNLGDHLTGPLDPAGTANCQKDHNFATSDSYLRQHVELE